MDQNCRDSPEAAQHPFNQSSADLILRTADLVDFRVHTQILAQSSPFFASMFELPQPTPTTHSEGDADDAGSGATPPVVPVSEDSKTLELLLRLIYPISKPRAQMEDPQTMVPALLAATKYDMTLPIDIMSDQLATIIAKSPLQVWAAACRTGLEGIARQAAEALKASWTDSDAHALSFMDELGDMDGISAANYYRLRRFLSAQESPQGESTFAHLTPARIINPWMVIVPDGPSPDPWTPEPVYANLPPTDVTCRSTSRMGQAVLFKAHQVILSTHSPVLRARLAEFRDAASSNSAPAPDSDSTPAPDSGSTSAQGTPSVQEVVLDFDEGPEVVSTLLTACYDAEELRLPSDPHRLAALVAASQKYKMAFVAPRIRASWDTAANFHPLEAYFVALAHGLTGCAEEAAKIVLRTQAGDAYDLVMEDAPALAYHRLLVFYDSCRTVVRERLAEAITSIPEDVPTLYHGTVSTEHGTNHSPLEGRCCHRA